jgi:hypothetical protein
MVLRFDDGASASSCSGAFRFDCRVVRVVEDAAECVEESEPVSAITVSR